MSCTLETELEYVRYSHRHTMSKLTDLLYNQHLQPFYRNVLLSHYMFDLQAKETRANPNAMAFTVKLN